MNRVHRRKPEPRTKGGELCASERTFCAYAYVDTWPVHPAVDIEKLLFPNGTVFLVAELATTGYNVPFVGAGHQNHRADTISAAFLSDTIADTKLILGINC